MNYGRFCASSLLNHAHRNLSLGRNMLTSLGPLSRLSLCTSRSLQTFSRPKPVTILQNAWISNHWNNKLALKKPKFWQRCRPNTALASRAQFKFSRNFSSSRNSYQQRNKTTAIYIIALVTVVVGGSYAAVPLYRIFCQASGLGGTVQQTDAGDKIKNMTAKKERLLTVRFNADKSATMQWAFKPQQTEVKVYPGETALAFYTAKNPTDVPITGISTYNVIPFEAGQYFNKIQCFCFEEQRLNPHEEVDMPVFFYIDPEFVEDPALYKVNTITLSYTFFQAKEAHDLGIQ